MPRLGSAWCPGGRTAQNALSASPPATASTAAIIAPAACSAAYPSRRQYRVSIKLGEPVFGNIVEYEIDITAVVDAFQLIAGG